MISSQYLKELPASDKMPVLFVGHGSPMNAIEENQFVASWKKLRGLIPRPTAIICISAHWETNGTFITAMEKPQTIHDFGGFPPELYQVQYPAPGSPQLAGDIRTKLPGREIGLDQRWGLDHGAWSVIKWIYPEADIPVLEISLDYNKEPKYHYQLAKELAFLRRKGVLIIGSGNMVHNLRLVAWDKLNEPGYAFEWAAEANETFKNLITAHKHDDLTAYQRLGDEIRLAVPTPDHFLPLLYTLALQEDNDELSFFNDEAVMGSLTMTSILLR